MKITEMTMKIKILKKLPKNLENKMYTITKKN